MILKANIGLMLLAALTGCAARDARVAGAERRHAARAKGEVSSDGSRCEHEEQQDREVHESASIGSLEHNIRRVYRVSGEGELRRRSLVCREMDTNLDGRKDVFRKYDEQGVVSKELADSNYDGVIDTWIRFDKGKIVQLEIDEAWDGQPDERRHYVRGKLTRIERDTNQDGATDVWEYYAAGRLDRMGVDLDHDGRVDRWSRDTAANGARGRDARSASATQGSRR